MWARLQSWAQPVISRVEFVVGSCTCSWCFSLGKVHLWWQGGGGGRLEILKREAWNFSSPPSLASQFFRSLPPVGFEVYKFSEPPLLVLLAPLSSSPRTPLVILNELSLTSYPRLPHLTPNPNFTALWNFVGDKVGVRGSVNEDMARTCTCLWVAVPS